MSRSVSSALRQAVYSQQTEEVFLMLLEISHDDIGPPTSLYFVNNYEDIYSNGQTYTGWPFEIHLPGDFDDQLPSIQLSIGNVAREIVDEIRTLNTAPDITLSVVLASSPNTVEAGPFEMKLRNVNYDAMVISGDLQGEDILNEPFPGHFYTPGNFPGLFK